MDIRTGFAEVNGTRLYYEVAGSGHSLVLIHGFTLDTRMWDDQLEPFAEHYRVVRYDCRGFGKSALPIDGEYTHADDLACLLAHLGIDRAYVVGLSMGGDIAVDFALTYPMNVGALVTVDATLGGYEWTPAYDGRFDSINGRRKEMDHETWVEYWLKCDIFDAAREAPGVDTRLREIILDYSACHILEGIWWRRRAEQPPATERLGEITAPTLVIVGERDWPDFNRIADTLEQGIRGARKVVFPGAGHMVNMELPDGFNRTVLDFLHEIGGPAAGKADAFSRCFIKVGDTGAETVPWAREIEQG